MRRPCGCFRHDLMEKAELIANCRRTPDGLSHPSIRRGKRGLFDFPIAGAVPRRVRRVKGTISSGVFLLSLVLLQSHAFCGEMIEKTIEYRTVPGDYGAIISGKLGMSWDQIARDNGIDPAAVIERGRILRVRFRRIVPEMIENGLVINIPDRTLYRFEAGRLKDDYFISAGRPTWQTPLGDFVITAKAKDPTWFVPPSIQKEMEAEGKEVVVEVPPGSDNPLGKYWLQLSIKGVGLHGTNAPQSIYKFRSHGCMRLRPEIAEFLYRHLPVGTPGRIIYKPVKMAKKDGRVFLEVYRDFYKMGIDYEAEAGRLAKELNATNAIDWSKVREALAKKDGIARDVSR
ncbi:MAG: L,D-transpeptidase [Nitrospirae bacterium]|nr:L,D-transpeptidase [Nitrospirota bacterium]